MATYHECMHVFEGLFICTEASAHCTFGCICQRAVGLCDMALLSNVSAELLRSVLGDTDYAMATRGKLTHRQFSNISSSSDFTELHPSGEQVNQCLVDQNSALLNFPVRSRFT